MAPKEYPRDERIPVLLTKAEREKLQAAADRAGLGLSTFIRVKALEALNGRYGNPSNPKPAPE